MTARTTSFSDFNTQESFQAAFNMLANPQETKALSIDHEGKLKEIGLIPAVFEKIKGTLGFNDGTNKTLIQLKALQLFVAGKKFIQPQDLQAIKNVAKNIGVPPTHNGEYRALLANMKESKISLKDQAEFIILFYKRHAKELMPYPDTITKMSEVYALAKKPTPKPIVIVPPVTAPSPVNAPVQEIVAAPVTLSKEIKAVQPPKVMHSHRGHRHERIATEKQWKIISGVVFGILALSTAAYFAKDFVFIPSVPTAENPIPDSPAVKASKIAKAVSDAASNLFSPPPPVVILPPEKSFYDFASLAPFVVPLGLIGSIVGLSHLLSCIARKVNSSVVKSAAKKAPPARPDRPSPDSSKKAQPPASSPTDKVPPLPPRPAHMLAGSKSPTASPAVESKETPGSEPTGSPLKLVSSPGSVDTGGRKKKSKSRENFVEDSLHQEMSPLKMKEEDGEIVTEPPTPVDDQGNKITAASIAANFEITSQSPSKSKKKNKKTDEIPSTPELAKKLDFYVLASPNPNTPQPKLTVNNLPPPSAIPKQVVLPPPPKEQTTTPKEIKNLRYGLTEGCFVQ